MTAKRPRARPRHGDNRKEQRAGAEVEREKRTKPESEMSKGKNYPSSPPENQGTFDPTSTRTPQGGGPD